MPARSASERQLEDLARPRNRERHPWNSAPCASREFLLVRKAPTDAFRTDQTVIFGLSSVRVGVPGPTADEISKSIDAYPGLQEVRRMAESDDEEDPSISLVGLKAKKAAAKKATAS